MRRKATTPGKIILSGEYAVIFGYPGVAVPAPLSLTATFEERSNATGVDVVWKQRHDRAWDVYLRRIMDFCDVRAGGILTIHSTIPLGKGMGSSTALVIAVTRALRGRDCHNTALAIEDTVNPGHSGIDFAVIWKNTPILFRRGEKPTSIHSTIHGYTSHDAMLLDTGTPNERTSELVAWVQSRKDEPEIAAALRTIGECTERIVRGQVAAAVLRDHHRAQVALGVVPPQTQELIKKIEQEGGAAKVIGAGGKTGGGGMVLALHGNPDAIVALAPNARRIV